MKNLVLIGALASVLASCVKKVDVGTAGNPIRIDLPPATELKSIEISVNAFKSELEKSTHYKFEIGVPASFAAVVAAFGEKKVHISALDTFGYIKARDQYGVEARLIVVRGGLSTYQSQFITKFDSGIKTLEDIRGRKIAFVDPNSVAGYLLPMKMLKEKKIEPKEILFAARPESVVAMVYQGGVDAGATPYAKPSQRGLEDARRLVMSQYPDVEKKVKIVELTDSLANDPIVFAKDLPEEMKIQITDAILNFLKTSEGKKIFQDLYAVDELKKANDQDYDSARELLKTLGKSPDDLIGK